MRFLLSRVCGSRSMIQSLTLRHGGVRCRPRRRTRPECSTVGSGQAPRSSPNACGRPPRFATRQRRIDGSSSSTTGCASRGLRMMPTAGGMAVRLAPGDSEPVALLLDLVAPARNHAHNRMGTALLKGKTPRLQEFNELADAASPDSLVAR